MDEMDSERVNCGRFGERVDVDGLTSNRGADSFPDSRTNPSPDRPCPTTSRQTPEQNFPPTDRWRGLAKERVGRQVGEIAIWMSVQLVSQQPT